MSFTPIVKDTLTTISASSLFYKNSPIGFYILVKRFRVSINSEFSVYFKYM